MHICLDWDTEQRAQTEDGTPLGKYRGDVMKKATNAVILAAVVLTFRSSMGFSSDRNLASLDAHFAIGSNKNDLLEFLSKNDFKVSILENGVWTSNGRLSTTP
ncbi:hypothetical protein DL239_19360 [Sedimentitalea sp. CY04]|uniref:Uncharacterized protein n=1 Tax=Parasedimentitalea denitrificans TaxID=2211118 RepID=A0ABX0WBX2_9RHOB|nr:hypothetical protein [Sedimentitalea sp. CY04]